MEVEPLQKCSSLKVSHCRGIKKLTLIVFYQNINSESQKRRKKYFVLNRQTISSVRIMKGNEEEKFQNPKPFGIISIAIIYFFLRWHQRTNKS